MEDWIAALKTVQNREHFEVRGECVPLHSLPPLLTNSLFWDWSQLPVKLIEVGFIDYNGYSVRPSVKTIPNTLKCFSKEFLWLCILSLGNFESTFQSMGRLWNTVLPLSFHSSVILPVLIHVLPAWYSAYFGASICFLGLQLDQQCPQKNLSCVFPTLMLVSLLSPPLCWHKHSFAIQ